MSASVSAAGRETRLTPESGHRIRHCPCLLCANWKYHAVSGSRASRPQMHRCRSAQRRQNKEHQAGPIGHRHNNDEPYAVPAGQSFDGKGDASDEEQRRQERLKQKKNLRPSRSDICAAPERTRRADGRGMIQGYRLAGKGSPQRLKAASASLFNSRAKQKNSDGWHGVIARKWRSSRRPRAPSDSHLSGPAPDAEPRFPAPDRSWT